VTSPQALEFFAGDTDTDELGVFIDFGQWRNSAFAEEGEAGVSAWRETDLSVSKELKLAYFEALGVEFGNQTHRIFDVEVIPLDVDVCHEARRRVKPRLLRDKIAE
jgi:hypothetical protein